jgi:tetratricopeptide (TPR) repeat protein
MKMSHINKILNHRLSTHFILVMACLAALAVYGPHFSNGLVFDDHPQIERSPLVTGTTAWTDAFQHGIWAHLDRETGSRDIYYRPLLLLIHRLTYQAGNGSAIAFHVLSLVLHLIATYLTYQVLRRLDLQSKSAAVATALFALHPLASETIYWAASAGEILLQISLLATVLLSMLAQSGQTFKRTLCHLGAMFSLACGLLSKETAVIIAIIVTLEAFRHTRKECISRLKASLPLWLMTIGYLWLRARIVSTDIGEILPDGLHNISLFGTGLIWYLKQFLIPYPLTSVHVLPIEASAWQLILGLSMTIFLLFTFVWCFFRRPSALFFLGWFFMPLLIALIPTLTSLEFVTGTPVAERYMYLSLVPWCASCVLLIKHLIVAGFPAEKRPSIGAAIGLTACLVAGTMSYSYGYAFQDDESFFQRAYAHAPENPHVLMWSGIIKKRQNQPLQALELFDKTMAINPEMPYLYVNRGLVLAQLDRLNEAVDSLQLAIQQNPQQSGVNFELARVLQDLGQIDAAIEHYRKELELTPDHLAAMGDLGLCLYMKNNPTAAVDIWQRALTINDVPYLRFNLGMAYRELGQMNVSAIHLQRFLHTANEGYAEQRRLARQWLNME